MEVHSQLKYCVIHVTTLDICQQVVFCLLLRLAAICGCRSVPSLVAVSHVIPIPHVLNNLLEETMMSAKTLLRIEPELSNKGVLITYRERLLLGVSAVAVHLHCMVHVFIIKSVVSKFL